MPSPGVAHARECEDEREHFHGDCWLVIVVDCDVKVKKSQTAVIVKEYSFLYTFAYS
jgi:hypothetical protein